MCYLYVVVGYNLVLFTVDVPRLCGEKNVFRNSDAGYIHFPLNVVVILWLPVGRISKVTYVLVSILRNAKFYTV